MSSLLTGLRAWVWQRVSAVYLLGFVGYLLVHFAFATPRTYAEWHAWTIRPAVEVATGLFFLMLLMHVWVGVRNILMDYVRSLPWRACLLALLAFAVLGQGAWVTLTLWSASGQ